MASKGGEAEKGLYMATILKSKQATKATLQIIENIMRKLGNLADGNMDGYSVPI